MALKGTLKDFSIADIFQLIGQQQKSGSLYITNQEQIAHIMFDRGMVVIARFKQSNEDLMIGNMLLRASVISEDQLEEAMENQQTTLRSIGDILLSLNYILPENLTEFVSLQVKEVLFKIFQWKDGLYEFVSEDFKYNKKLIKLERSEQLLLDGFRMLDEWPGILKKINSLTTVYKSIIDPSRIKIRKEGEKEGDDAGIDQELEMAFKEYTEGEKIEGPIPSGLTFVEKERKVLLLIDGERSIKDIVYLSRMGTFETCSIIVSLLDKGAVMKTDFASPAKSELSIVFKSTLLSKKKFFFRFISNILILSAFTISLPSLIFYFSSNIMARNSSNNGFYTNIGGNYCKKYLKVNGLESLRVGVELYRFKNSNYPESLKDIGAEKIFYYRKSGSGFILLP